MLTRTQMILTILPCLAAACATPSPCPPCATTISASGVPIAAPSSAAPNAQPPKLEAPQTPPPANLSHADAVADTRELIRLLESSHPDLYQVFGGKVPFKLAVNELLASLPKEGMTRQALVENLSAFLARLQDGHARPLYELESAPSSDRLPGVMVSWGITNDAELFMEATDDPTLEKRFGYRLAAVNDVPVEALLKKERQFRACENRYHAAVNLNDELFWRDTLSRLVPLSDATRCKLTLLSPTNKREGFFIDLNIPPGNASGWRAEMPPWNRLESFRGPFHSQVFDMEKVAYLRVKKNDLSRGHRGSYRQRLSRRGRPAQAVFLDAG